MNRADHVRQVPFFRPQIGEEEILEVARCLRSGWLTTGALTRRFEEEFAAAVGATHALALNSCTAALHLAVEALDLGPGQAVLVPTLTFAATAEVVRYRGAVPLFVDCDPTTLNIDLVDAARRIEALRAGETPLDPSLDVVGIMPVHVGGLMVDMDAVADFARTHALWIVEDAAHALPAAFLNRQGRWQRCGENTAAVTCFSFYATKTITTGEGGMAVTEDPELAARMRQLSLHGLSRDAWDRHSSGGTWDYQVVAPGFKYNLTDIASAIGVHQLARAGVMRADRAGQAARYDVCLADVTGLEGPPNPADRVHSWHLYPIRLHLDQLTVDRNEFMMRLRHRGVGCSVHWRPLHMQPYYAETFHWQPDDFPVAAREWQRLVTLPLFQGMRVEEAHHVIDVVRAVCAEVGGSSSAS